MQSTRNGPKRATTKERETSTYDNAKQAIVAEYDEHNGTYEIPGAGEAEDWGEVIAVADERGGTYTKRDDLKGWGEWTEVWDVPIPELGDYVYLVGPGEEI